MSPRRINTRIAVKRLDGLPKAHVVGQENVGTLNQCIDPDELERVERRRPIQP